MNVSQEEMPIMVGEAFRPANIKLFVALHEDTYIPPIPFGAPIQIGAANADTRIEGCLHDDEGDTLSPRAAIFRDLTAQYWAWRNAAADYYGFMQYNRYLRFGSESRRADGYGVVTYGLPDDPCFRAMGYDEQTISQVVCHHGIIVSEQYRLEGEQAVRGVRGWYDDDRRRCGGDLDRLADIVRRRCPSYREDVDAFLAGDWVLNFDIFVMDKVHFHEYANFLFTCLFEFAESIDERVVSPYAAKAPKLLAVCMLSIYVRHCLRTEGDSHILFTQIGYFTRTDRPYLYPAFERNNCPIVFSSSDKYSIFVGVAIQSIVDNASPGNNYDIIILDTGMRDASRMLLLRQIEGKSNISLRFIDIELQLKTRDLPSAHHITIGTFGRFLTLDYLVGYDKVIYLDCDLVVNADIAVLSSVELDDCLVAAVRDTAANGWYHIPGHEMRDHIDRVIKITEPSGYFNAGVLIMNLAELRRETTCEELMQLAIDPRWLWLDQDVLNYVCRGRVKYLDQAWNYMAHKESYAMPLSLPEVWLPCWLQEAYAKAQKNPFIVHYAGHSIPCFASEADCYWYFWKYARASLFYERVLKVAMSETVEQEQMSATAHIKSAVGSLKDIIKRKVKRA